MERHKDRGIERFFFSFVLVIYNLLFQDIYVVLLMNFYDINFDFSIFQEIFNESASYNLILLVKFDYFIPFLIFCIFGYNCAFLMHSIDQ